MPALISGTLVIAIGSNSAGSFNHLATGKIQVLADAARLTPRLLVRKDLVDSGQVTRISDLRGLSVRVPREGSASHYALHKILTSARVPDAEVTLMFLDEQVAIAELRRTGLDAAILNEPYASEALGQGIVSEPWAAQLAPLFGEHGQQHMVLFVNREYASKHPAHIESFLEAYRDGIRDYLRARENPTRSPDILDIIATYTGAPRAVVLSADWPWVSPDGMPNLDDLRDSQDFFVSTDLIAKRAALTVWTRSER